MYTTVAFKFVGVASCVMDCCIHLCNYMQCIESEARLFYVI